MNEKQAEQTRKPIGIRLDTDLIDLLWEIGRQPGTVWTGMSRTALIEYAIKFTFDTPA